MKETINLEQAVLENLRILPPEKQQAVLDFVQFLVHKAEKKNYKVKILSLAVR